MPVRPGVDMKKILVLLIIAGALAGVALNYNFILFDNKMKMLKKTELTFEDTFVDARGAKKLNLLSKPALINAGIKDILDAK
jgi:hypothetical protein